MRTPNEDDRLKQIASPLLRWYDANARILPWRNDPTPYRVWVSEIMLQQTRVEAVKPYFERFIKAVPDISALAAADEDVLLKLWEGLGYYSRVKNMRKAAVLAVEKYSGALPSTYDELIKLPGIGAYTASAVASIAFGEPQAVVDGNVLRVISRLLSAVEDIAKEDVRKKMKLRLNEIMPKDRAEDFNQAMMELGATVCLPNGAPLCDGCPVASSCSAYHDGTVMSFPVKQSKKKRRIEEKTVLIFLCDGKIGVRRRRDKGLLASLWEYPNAEGSFTKEDLENYLTADNVAYTEIQDIGNAKHIFTHIEWHMRGYLIRTERCDAFLQMNWITKEELTDQYSVPSAFSYYTKKVMQIL